MTETVMQEAQRIIYGDREQTYGHPSKNFDNTALYWTAHLKARYGIALDLDATDVALMMVLLKMAREIHQHKRDNIVDGIGYFGCIQKMVDYVPVSTYVGGSHPDLPGVSTTSAACVTAPAFQTKEDDE